MAEKRMFSKKITSTDIFLDMPVSAQNLYFHLNVEADDDGFIGKPKAIMRSVKASDDDLKVLLAKRYVLGFESGVIVIKHWRIHNILRKDRYTPTTYVEELNTLTIDEKGSYTENFSELATKRQPSGNQAATKRQPSIDESSIDKISIESNARARQNSFVLFSTLKNILESNCPILAKRIQNEIDRGNTNLIYEIESILENSELNEEQLTKLFSHVSKTYVCQPNYSNLGVKWVLLNVKKVLELPQNYNSEKLDVNLEFSKISDSGESLQPLEEYKDFCRYKESLALRYLNEKGIVCVGYEKDGDGLKIAKGFVLDDNGYSVEKIE